MRLSVLLGGLLTLLAVSTQPQINEPTVQPYFAAVVVRDLDTSSAWYQSLFGLSIVRKEAVPDRKIRFAILESSSFLVELIEDKSALDRSQLLEKSPEGTNIHGHFKIGFKVTAMDMFLKRLERLKIDLGRIYSDSSGKRNFLIKDPDGNLIQFFE